MIKNFPFKLQKFILAIVTIFTIPIQTAADFIGTKGAKKHLLNPVKDFPKKIHK